MDHRQFFKLLQRASGPGVWDEISAAIARSPGLPLDTWSRRWDVELVGDTWRPRGNDGGFSLIGYPAWVRAFRSAGYLEGRRRTENLYGDLPVKAAPLPDEPILLFRGCDFARRLGMSWTPDRDVARACSTAGAHGRSRLGEVYAAWVDPSWLLAQLDCRVRDNRWPYQLGVFREFVVDTGLLDHQRVWPVEVPAANHAEMLLRYGRQTWDSMSPAPGSSPFRIDVPADMS